MNQTNIYGYNLGTTTVVSGSFKTGDKRRVWVDLDGIPRVYLPLGGTFLNPFHSGGKAFQGDLIEYRTDETLLILKTFKVIKAVTAEDTAIYVERDQFKHTPHFGLNLMKAPTTLAGKGNAGLVTMVEEATITEGPAYKLTITANALGTLSIGDILVEATAAGAGKGMLVTNPNSFVSDDIMFNFTPNTGGDVVNGAIYNDCPIYHGVAYINRMRPLPECFKVLNKSRVPEWFEL
ncbi:MAG: hypothetical protein ACRCX5_11455 [Bacteroidales bacterium]